MNDDRPIRTSSCQQLREAEANGLMAQASEQQQARDMVKRAQESLIDQALKEGKSYTDIHREYAMAEEKAAPSQEWISEQLAAGKTYTQLANEINSGAGGHG